MSCTCKNCCGADSNPLVPGTKPNRPLTYLASPYSHKDPAVIKDRVRGVTQATVWLIREKDWNVFSPIVHSHPLAEAGLQGGWGFWKLIDTEYLSVSARMVVLAIEGWRESVGVQAEIKIAEGMGIPVYYMRPDSVDWSRFVIQSVPFGFNPWDPEPEKRVQFTPTPGAPPPYDAEKLRQEGLTCESNKTAPWEPPITMGLAEHLEHRSKNLPPEAFAENAGSVIRKFETGATRDSEEGKYDYEGFLSPLVLEEYGKYMHHHRKQSDGNLRDSDNWQKGIPRKEYIKSIWRHFLLLWKLHRGLEARDEKGNLVTIPEMCSAILFNVQGYLFEYLHNR